MRTIAARIEGRIRGRMCAIADRRDGRVRGPVRGMTGRLESRVRRRLDGLDEQGLRRTLRPPSGIDLTSNDYLGLAQHPRITEAMMAAVAREGVGSTGSRLLRGEREAFAGVERRFAAFKGAERALYFSSGYLANIAVLTTFAEAGDLIVSDARNHASLIDGIRLSPARREIVPHNDVDAVRRVLTADREAAKGRLKPSPTAGDGERFLVVESLFGMDGDEAPLADYAAICADTGSHLVVDEAHAVGVYGRRGSGLVEECGVQDEVTLAIGTAGKAMGVAGAFVTGRHWAIDYLVQRARPFIFSTAPPPAVAAALGASLDVIEEEPERRAIVLQRARQLRARLVTAGISVPPGRSHIVPIVIGDNESAVATADALQAEGFDVRAIRPPTVPAGTARLRISVNVNLTDDQIERFVEALIGALAAREAQGGS
jgi:8-amino-7-oxononanoate synthase